MGDSNLSVLNLVILKKGEQEIPGLTDRLVPRRLGPKRVGKIRKLFNLTKEDDVTQYIIRKPVATPEGKPEPKKPKTKAPKIQRLVTPQRLQRKRHAMALKRARANSAKQEAAVYAKLLAKRHKELKEKRHQQHMKRRLSSLRESKSH